MSENTTRLRNVGRGLRLSAMVVAGLLLTGGEPSMVFGSEVLKAQGTEQADRVPTGWMLAGSRPTDYRAGLEPGAARETHSSAYLRWAGPQADGLGTLMQTIDAEKFAGKRVRLQAQVKAQEVGQWAGLWMRVDKGQTAVAFDNMQERAIKGTQGWKTYDVVLDVSPDASDVAFGLLLAGSGEVWVSHATLEQVGPDVQLTGASQASGGTRLSKSPVNLDFSN